MSDARTCAWCKGPISPRSRRDAITCSTRCRQARNRFVQGVGTPPPVDGGHPLRLAYADPPYPGRSRKYYGHHPDYAGEVDHANLIASMSADYDGWALSTSADALREVWALCPPGTRLAVWVRGERPNKRSRGPQNSYEPVLFAGGRLHIAAAGNDGSPRSVTDASATAVHLVDATRRGSAHDTSRGSSRRVDSLIYRPGARTTDPARVIGAKPAVFIRWVFDLLGALPGDEFVDIFPGSGGVARAWEIYAKAGA